MKKQKEKIEKMINQTCEELGMPANSMRRLATIKYLKEQHNIDIYKKINKEVVNQNHSKSGSNGKNMSENALEKRNI